jgi:hypothetical protein
MVEGNLSREGLMDSTNTGTMMSSPTGAPKAPFTTLPGLARHITIAGFSGLFAGVIVGGFGSRLFMRMASFIASDAAQGRRTEAGFTVGEVTFGGTVELIIFIGIFTGLVAAVFYVIFFPWLTWAGSARGVAFGVLGFGAASATTDVMNPDNIDFVILKNEPILVVMIFVLFLAFGAAIDLAYRVIERYMPEPGGDVNAVFYTFSLLGSMFLFLAVIVTFSSEGCDCDPPLRVAWSIVATGMATIAWWASILASSTPKWFGRASAVIGFLGTAGVLLFGLIRALSDAAEIIG